MNRPFAIFWLVVMLVIAQACHKKSVPQTTLTPPNTTKMVIAQPVEFTYLTSKGKVQFEGRGDKISSAINLRMRKDSVIWVSVVPGLGIEAARALFTPDSIKILDRLHKTYIATDYRYLKRAFNIDADFQTLQALLLGNQPYPVSPDLKVVQTEPQFHTQQMRGNVRVNSFIELSNLKLKKIQLSDSVSKNSLAVTYADFAQLDNFVFPYSAIFLAQQHQTEPPKSLVLTINHNKVSLSEPKLDFPFNVPAGYERQR